MKNKELIEQLNQFNPEAEVDVIACNRSFGFSFAWGDTDGEETINVSSYESKQKAISESKQKAKTISLYVDELCKNDVVHVNNAGYNL